MPATGHEDAAEIVSGFYDVALGQESWERVGARLERFARAQSSFIWRLDADGRTTGGAASAHLRDPAVVAAYVTHYGRLDPWSRACAAEPGTRVRRGTDFLAREEFERSEWYAGYCRGLGIYHAAGAVFRLGAGGGSAGIALHRPRDARDFADADLRRLGLLVPHLQRALQLGRRLGAETGRSPNAAQGGFEVLDALAAAAVVSDANARVLFANRAAEELARVGDGLRLSATGPACDRSVLGASHPADARALLALVRAAALGGPGGAVALRPRSPGLPPLAALVSPLPSRLCSGPPRPAALVLVAAPHARGVAPSLLARLFGLTAAEAEVATALADGLTAEEVAVARSVGTATVRSQARAVLAKTGCRDLRGLARIVGALGALRRG